MVFQCSDCGNSVNESKQEHNLKIEFSNPGVVFVKAEVMECSFCQSKFSDENDAERIFSKIEEEYSKKHRQ